MKSVARARGLALGRAYKSAVNRKLAGRDEPMVPLYPYKNPGPLPEFKTAKAWQDASPRNKLRVLAEYMREVGQPLNFKQWRGAVKGLLDTTARAGHEPDCIGG